MDGERETYRDGLAYAFWCLFLVGLAGVHRIYLGRYGTGILWMLTFGLFGVGQVVDLFRMRKLVLDANVREGRLPHPRWVGLLNGRSPSPEERPRPAVAPLTPMQRLLKAAMANGGGLTVTQGVAATGLGFEEVEETLREMVVKGYVDVDNAPDTGVVVYRFVELG